MHSLTFNLFSVLSITLNVLTHLPTAAHSFVRQVSESKTNTFVSKTGLKGPLKKFITKVLKSNGSLMKVESIAECSLGAFCNTFNLH